VVILEVYRYPTRGVGEALALEYVFEVFRADATVEHYGGH